MKVSVIIAAYNAEKYISETLNSIIYQTIDDFEVIVVNDGSTDSTLDILLEYKEKFKEFYIINQENSGPSAARNAALDIARGEFIYFIDADDIAEGNSLEMMYERAVSQKADVVIAKYDIFSSYSVQTVSNINPIVQADNVDKYDKKILWTFALWNKLFKRELIEKNQIRFPLGISYSEDGVFVMNCVYNASKITGLDYVVLHYRKMYYGEGDSITASVNPRKVKDYIGAHEIIIDSAEKSWLKTYPQYKTIKELRKAVPDADDYLNEIAYKEVQVLFNQFYSKLWDFDDNTIKMITDEINRRFLFMDMKRVLQLQKNHVGVSISHLAESHEEVLQNAHFSVALFGNVENQDDFLKSLQSLSVQNLVGIKIFVPSAMEAAVQEAGLVHGNVFFVEAETEQELFNQVLDTTDSPFISFANPRMVYVNNVFKIAYQTLVASGFDFVTQTIGHRTYAKPQPIYYSIMAFERWNSSCELDEYLCLDHTLANKFFRTSYLRGLKENVNKDILENIEEIYRSAFFIFKKDNAVIFNGNTEEFLEFIKTDALTEFLKEMFSDVKVSLNAKELERDANRVSMKLIALKRRNFSEKMLNKALSGLRRLKVQDQVLFLSIRKDGELEGNAKALYPYVKGKKVICAKQLPHSPVDKLRMCYQIVTSKVIVTDDYIRYLRHFPLKPEQKVIQLWHACGAFKMFGRHGGNLAERIDIATHAQYNLVSVSADNIRMIYADAFDVDYKKVQALGTPRTDTFFDKTYAENCRKKVLEKYPEFGEKYVIIYAPTFRDTNGDRTVFKPDLDFEKLSKSLLPNQMFVICPHPLMKNQIVDKEYDNIKVVRDFSTNDMMFVSDMLITDYSSVIFEYALLDKPIAFFCYDLEMYDRGFYLDYPDDLPGDVLKTENELFEFLKTAESCGLSGKFERFKEKYMSACDGHSCERIANLINSYMEE